MTDMPEQEPVPADTGHAQPAEPAGAVAGVTGQAAVDAALEQLDAVADQPPAEQVAAYEAAHRTLTATLSAIDSS